MDSFTPENIPQKQCKACKDYFPETDEFFVKKPSCKNGLDAYCRKCRYAYNKANQQKPKTPKPEIPDGYKRCSKCKDSFPATNEFFYAHQLTLDKLNPSCKKCEKTRYRVTHPERVLVSDAPEGYKRCAGCRRDIIATLEYFHALKSEKDGLHRICKACRTQKRIAERLARIDKARAYERAIRRKNAEYYRKYHEANRERIKARGRQHYYDRLDYYKEYGKAYRKSHPEGRRARDRNRRARLRALGGVLTQWDIQQQFRRQKGKCYYCHTKIHLTIHGKAGYHADHIVPISREGSSNDINNIVLTCPTCNLKKGNKLPHEWPEGNRLL